MRCGAFFAKPLVAILACLSSPLSRLYSLLLRKLHTGTKSSTFYYILRVLYFCVCWKRVLLVKSIVLQRMKGCLEAGEYIPVRKGKRAQGFLHLFPFSESSIKTVLNQSAKKPDFSRQSNQSPH